MTTFTMRYVKGVPPMRFKSRVRSQGLVQGASPRLARNRDRPQEAAPIQVSWPDAVISRSAREGSQEGASQEVGGTNPIVHELT